MSAFVRGTRASFEAEFVDLDGNAMVAAGLDLWPQVVIKDPDGSVIITGLGRQLDETGKYRFNWFVPEDATLSGTDTKWEIYWSFVTIQGHSRDHSETFDVVDKIESTPEERQQTYITNDGGTVRALYRSETRLYKIALTVKTQSGATLYSIDGVATNDLEKASDNPNRLLNEKAQNGEYIYFYDLGPLSAGEYLLFWTVQESEVSSIDVEIQIARAAPDLFWHYNVELRTLIDKLQKKTGIYQAYSAADIYSYVKGGLDILNFYKPTTNWVLADIPLTGSRGVRTALIYASAIHAINAQQILEVELSFDHSGQIVNLGYNHDYSGILGNLQKVLDIFGESKFHIFLVAHGAAYAGGRPKNYRFTNRVFRLDRALRGAIPPGGVGAYRYLGL